LNSHLPCFLPLGKTIGLATFLSLGVEHPHFIHITTYLSFHCGFEFIKGLGKGFHCGFEFTGGLGKGFHLVALDGGFFFDGFGLLGISNPTLSTTY